MSKYVTSDRNHPDLHAAGNDGQNKVYLVLSEEERAKGFVRPVRFSYVHNLCGTITKMGLELSETYARDPQFYGATFCVGCRKHYEVSQFSWTTDGSVVGS